MTPPPFQNEAVKLIVARLTSRRGSRRFLLADEVGLGKTHVAKGVIDELRRPRKPLVVFYISSNKEIAHQNRRKLSTSEDKDSGEATEPIVDRLTLFAPHVRPAKPLKPRAVRLLTLTPGTSLYLGRSTGVRDERLLLLYFIRRIRRRLFTKKSRETFKCNVAGKQKWLLASRWSSLRNRFPGVMDRQLLRLLRTEWRHPLADFAEVLKAHGKVANSDRNRVIGDLRKGLARAVIQALAPGLIVLDEFQRFRELILRPEEKPETKRKEHVLEDWFFGKECPPVLLLSATPYRMYATKSEGSDEDSHLKELIEVLQFVAGATSEDRELHRLKDLFGRFRKRIETVPSGETRDAELLTLKHDIETRLRQWMCRTERNWYYADERKGVDDEASLGLDSEAPTEIETTELARLSELVLQSGSDTPSQVIDYWKSAPTCLAFMSDEYQVQRRLKSIREPAIRKMRQRLLPSAAELPELIDQNLKLRNLATRVFGHGPQVEAGPPASVADLAASWRYLWCSPSYKYWDGGIFGEGQSGPDPTKFLIFSHWRFVPGAIATLMSQAIERAIDCSMPAAWARTEPLRFRQDRSLGAFDVCFPSPALAEIVDPTRIALDLAKRASRRKVTLDAVERVAIRRLLKALKVANVTVATGRLRDSNPGSASLWRIVAKLERTHVRGDRKTSPGSDWWLSSALRQHRPRDSRSGRSGQSYELEYVSDYADWIDHEDQSGSTIRSITSHQFRRLLQVALHSPAVCALRAVRRAVPGAGIEACYGAALEVGLSGVRHFFNRPYARQIVDGAAPGGRGYADRVLAYCGAGQLQAVLDEYAFLLAEQETSVDRESKDVARAVLKGISGVLSLGLGAPRVRVRGKKRGTHQGRSHFALAFAEESSEQGGGRSRRRHTREAFNSPFWPFVLATTSVGQEGLDFHWYCRDVVHWNLPSNPVDLEQREGRVNRRNGLVVRRNIARDIKLRDVALESDAKDSVWSGVFRTVGRRMSGAHHERHGLFPHWLYEGERTSKKPERIRRHVFSYWGSRDRERYARLKQDLALYRLVFGQVNQEDLLARLREKATGLDAGPRGLEAYMLNLAPFPKGFAWEAAQREVRERLKRFDRGDVAWFRTLVREAKRMLRQYEKPLGPEGCRAGRRLCDCVVGWLANHGKESATAAVGQAAAALTYLRNPYDDRFDVHRLVGFEDDAKRLIDVARILSLRP